MIEDLLSMRKAIIDAMVTLGGERLGITQIWDEVYKGLSLPDEEFDAMSQSFDMALEDMISDEDVIKHGNGSYTLV